MQFLKAGQKYIGDYLHSGFTYILLDCNLHKAYSTD